MDNFSKTLFDSIYDKLFKKFASIEDLNFEGIWAFLSQPGANSLQSCYYQLRDVKLQDSDETAMNNAFINYDEGSLGKAFNDLQSSDEKIVHEINTFNDPSGIVCILDAKIKQQHAAFEIVKHGNNKILGMIDVFFSGNNLSDKEKFKKVFTDGKILDDECYILCQSAFITKKYELLSERNDTDDVITSPIIDNTINNIKKILSLFSETPIFYIEKEDFPEKFVGFNYEYIHSIIKYQYRYCSLINNVEDCPYYACTHSDITTCKNKFLQVFFYKILSDLELKYYQYDSIRFLDNCYKIRYWAKNNVDNTLFDNLDPLSIRKEFTDFEKYDPLKANAKDKFKDEKLFDILKNKLINEEVTAFAIERSFNPHLISQISCDIIQKRKEITPSALLRTLHGEEANNKAIINKGKNNIVNVEILNQNKIFEKALERGIANNPQYYIDIIKNYLEENSFVLEDVYGLKFHFAGNNPFTHDLIKGQLNEQILQIATYIGQLEKEKLAVKSALAQVMARNTSHNIGAHVMNNLIGDLRMLDLFKTNKLNKLGKYQSETLKSLYENDIARIIKNCKKDIKKENCSIRDIQDLRKKINDKIIFDQIGIFNNYVKCRMDYLADIALGTPLMQTNKYAYRDLFRDFDKVRLLLEHISGLSDFKYKIEFKKTTLNKGTNEVETKDLKDDDLLVAMPNDILGQQAFYNILENIIRNTAKHSGVDGDRIFTVDFIDESKDFAQKEILKDYIAVEVSDDAIVGWEKEDVDSEDNNQEKNSAKEKEEQYKTVKQPNYMDDTGKDINKKIDYLVYCQNRTVNDDILKANSLRHHSLGMIEMDASAAYLRKKDVVLINDNDYDIEYNNDNWANAKRKPYFFKAINKNGHLGYRFFLVRPALALVITDADCKDREAELKKKGIWIETPDVYKRNLEDGKVYSHEFAVYDKRAKDIKEISNNATSLPIRILEFEDSDITFFLKQTEFEKELWKKWNDKIKLIFDQYITYPLKDSKKAGITHHNEKYERKDDYYYYDALSSAALQKLPNYCDNIEIETYETDILREDETARIKLGESIVSRIVVIDERIQENSKEDYLKIPLKNLYPDTGIIIPSIDNINLSASSLFDKRKSIIDWIEKYIDEKNGIEKLNNNTDFILIHYAILERMFQSNYREIETYLKELGVKCNVVITSGRGEPDGLPPEVRFLNLSSVIYSLVTVRSKYFANYVLHLSRKSSKIKKYGQNILAN
jgi:signal transduction histidine kinase